MNIALNNEQKLFVVSTGNSVGCIGFQVVYEQARELGRRLKSASENTLLAKGLYSLLDLVSPQKDQIGTVVQYEQYRALLAGYSKLGDTKTWFDGRTPKKVQVALEKARKDGTRVRVFLGDTKTGRDWLETDDNIGRIGRDGADVMKSPTILPYRNDSGPSLLTQCIVRIINVATGEELYRHAKYHTPKLVLCETESYDQAEGFSHRITVVDPDGEVNTLGKFKSQGQAAHWMAYVCGESHDYVSCRYPD